MPMKTATSPASAISCISSSSSARSSDASVKKASGIAVLLLPVDDGAEDLLGGLLVADEVVVDQEDHPRAQPVLGLDLGDDLLGPS